MRRRSGMRRALKWAFTSLMVLVLAAWMFAARVSFDVTQRYSVGLTGREVDVLLWGSPRASAQPDHYTYPLWIPLTMAGGGAGVFWLLDRRRATPGLCANCGYDLTGNVSGRCSECGAPVGSL